MWRRLTLALALLSPLAGPAAGQTPLATQQQKAFGAALEDWGRSVGTLGYVYGTPLLELAIAEYRQTQGLAPDISGPRGLLAHLMGGRLPTHETRWFTAPNPDVLYSSAWLYLKQQPYVLFIPPMDGHWYSVQFEDAFMNDVGYLSSRTIGSVGGWYLVAPTDWKGAPPPGVQGEIRVPTPVTWVLIRIAATRKNEAALHSRYQAHFKFLPLDVYRRNPRAAAHASAVPQTNTPPPPRALDDMRGKLDAFRVINHQLRQLEVKGGEAALMALFDRAGFGPHVEFDPSRLPQALVDGLRDAARDGQCAVSDFRFQPQITTNGWSRAPETLGVYGDDYLLRAISAFGGIGANIPAEAVYPNAYTDRDGRLLDGRYDYRIRFEPGGLPPAKAFWSIAAYDEKTRLLFDTGTDRYSVGSLREELVTRDDGALEILVSSDAPEDPAARANWLPVRTRPFFLIARIYEPEPAALDGSYALPPVVRLDE